MFGSTLTDAVEKFCLFLQFMQSPETELDWNDSSVTVTTIQVRTQYYIIMTSLIEPHSGDCGICILSSSTAAKRQDKQCRQ